MVFTSVLTLFVISSLAPFQTPTPSPSPAVSPMEAPSALPAPSPDGPTLVLEADAHFAQRSVGAIDEVANRHEIDAAIDLYRKAMISSPRDVETLAKLMRALHFRGAYTEADIEEKKAIFEEGRKLGQDAIDRLEAEARATPALSRIEALRLVNGAPALYLWTAGHLGEWGLVRGKFAAARSGVAAKLRDLAQTVVDLDPAYEGGAGYRILGRLHSEAPKIPFITGWVSHGKGVEYLRRAYELAPHHPVTLYFLAEAILDHEPTKREEALRFLDLCANSPPRLEAALEDARYSRLARRQLGELRSAP